MHARKVHAREMHAREMHAREMHAREMHARETPTNGGAVVDLSRSELQKRIFALVVEWSRWRVVPAAHG
jgi:hypothetical protein